jgi:hypothetical protein
LLLFFIEPDGRLALGFLILIQSAGAPMTTIPSVHEAGHAAIARVLRVPVRVAIRNGVLCWVKPDSISDPSMHLEFILWAEYCG